MKCIFPLLLLICINGISQRERAVEVASTEFQFSLKAQINGTKPAFLHFLDSNCIGIDRTGFINLYQVWKKRKEERIPLIWEPASVLAFSSGLVGITNGPYYIVDSGNARIGGTFFTVWYRNDVNSPYKAVFDTGFPLSAGSFPHDSLNGFTYNSHTIAISSSTIDTIAIKTFFMTVSNHSLSEAISKYSLPKADIFFTTLGKIRAKSSSSSDPVLSSKYMFQKLNSLPLSNGSVLLDYGTFSNGSFTTDEVKGHYVHVWGQVSNKPRLLAAIYKPSTK